MGVRNARKRRAEIRRQGRIHHRQIDHIPVEDAVIIPTIGIRERLARKHIERCQRGDSANIRVHVLHLFMCIYLKR